MAVGLRDLGFDVPDAQGNFVWLPGGPLTRAYAAAFVGAGVAVRPFASGGDWDGVRITVGESWECSWTTFLKKGQITVQGPFFDTGDSVLAITGGTGKYRNARGEMELKFHDATGTKFDFIFHVIG